MLRRDAPPPTLVQFSGLTPPAERDHRLLGDFLRDHPSTTVGFSGAYLSPQLSWLEQYSGAGRVSLFLDGVTSFEPLRSLRPDLEQLTLSGSTKGRVSLAPLRHFTALRELTIVGHRNGLETVAQLRSLERLCLISLKLPDLEMFEPLSELRAFELKLGGTTNLTALPRIGRLRYLEIWRVNGLSDLSVIAELMDLQYLFLQHVKRVEHLPSLRPCRHLRRVHLDRVAIRDLRAIADAPNLEELLLLDMPQLPLDAFRPLVNHPALRALTAGVRNETRRAQIRSLVGLGDVQSYGTDFHFEPLVPAMRSQWSGHE